MAAPRTTFRCTTTRAGALIIAMVLSIASFWQNSHLLHAPALQDDRANSNASGLAVDASTAYGQSESQSNHPQATITNTASSAAQHQSYFIIHVGPPKTATTTLQYGLRDINLTADGLLYFHHPKSPSPADAALIRNLRNDDCHKKYKQQQQLNRHDDDGNTTAPDCWQPFVNELIHDRQLYGPNISWLYSSETFGIGTNPQPFYWQGLQQSLQRTLGIRLVVVITYRRYAAWLLSCHGHVTKYTGRKPAWERWGSGRRVDGLLPLVIQERHKIGSSMHFPFLYTDQMRQRIVGDNDNQSASMDVRLLNLHHTMYTSPMSILLCDVLKEVTPRSCMQSIAQDANHEANNTLRLNSAATQESDERRPTISNYDRIVTAAHDAGLLTTTNTTSLPIKRRAAGLQCRDWHQNTLQESEFDLPMECPNESHVETLWNWTLAKETALLGPALLNTVDLRREFDKLVAYPRLCVVNATAVLQNSTWASLWKLLL
jgi:hypothetical protein